jgi:3-isopropylmalate/(R)-2-methylmalate dehydratase small subunit
MELTPQDAAKYAMNPVDPDFASTVRPGDIIVAGKNFGSGSSRETAPLSLRHLQIGAIVAKFFARIFYRNAINLGIPVVECDKADTINKGDALEIDFTQGVIINKTQNVSYQCSQLPPHIQQLIQAGGLIAHLKTR